MGSMAASPKKTEEDMSKKGGPKRWWRSSDDELVAGRVREVKGLVKGMKGPPPGDSEVEATFREASKDPRYRNLLDMVPVRTDAFDRKGSYLLLPVYKSSWGRKLATFLGLKQERRFKLDSYGWAVWELCDGRRDVCSVGRALKVRFGDEVEPLYPRLTKFLAYLVHLELVRLEGPKEEP